MNSIENAYVSAVLIYNHKLNVRNNSKAWNSYQALTAYFKDIMQKHILTSRTNKVPILDLENPHKIERLQILDLKNPHKILRLQRKIGNPPSRILTIKCENDQQEYGVRGNGFVITLPKGSGVYKVKHQQYSHQGYRDLGCVQVIDLIDSQMCLWQGEDVASIQKLAVRIQEHYQKMLKDPITQDYKAAKALLRQASIEMYRLKRKEPFTVPVDDTAAKNKAAKWFKNFLAERSCNCCRLPEI